MFLFARKNFYRLAVILALSMLSACALAPKEIAPAVLKSRPLPEHYDFSNPSENSVAVNAHWWQTFQSPELNRLMDSAQTQSPDLLILAERVNQAEFQLRIAQATLFPWLNATASTSETRTKNGADATTRSELTRVALAVNYEIDLWGGLAANRSAAKAAYQATVYDAAAANLSINAAIASSYFQLLALQARVATTKKNIAIAERVQKIIEVRYENGAATAADVAQQKTNLLNQQASLLPLELQMRQTQSALAILLGQIPGEFTVADSELLSIKVPSINAGTPAELLTRRPDVAAVEADLRAANADIRAARAALLPGISLGLNMGKSASELFRLTPATQTSGWSLALAQAIFNGGRLVNQKRLSEARRNEMVLQYHKAILVALQEVDDALASLALSQRQELSQQEIIANAQRSFDLIETRYRAGTDDLLSLLDAQRSLFQAQDAFIQQRLARLIAAVDVCKALGGGRELR